MKTLTKKMILEAEPNEILGRGYFMDDINEYIGLENIKIINSKEESRFVVVKGEEDDWVIYIATLELDPHEIPLYGAVVGSRYGVQKLIGEVDDDVWEMYRL